MTYVSQGVIEQRLERFEEAQSSFRRAVDLNPRCPLAVTHLANANVAAGRIEQALVGFETAIAADPRRAATHFRYSRAKRFTSGKPTQSYIDQLRGLVSDTDRRDTDQVQLNFALAKVLDDVGRYDEAWCHYDRGNRLKPGHTRSLSRRRQGNAATRPRTPLKRVAEQARCFFTQKFFETHRGMGDPSATPVFIVGMPRSGTTLTEQILCSHPAIAGAGELKLIDRIRQEVAGGHPPSPATPNDPSSGGYPDALASFDRGRLREMAGQYLAHLDSLRDGESRVTDKMPTNFIHLGLIALLFPNATVIHCRRNPMDVLVSCYCQNLNAPFCDLEQLVLYHQQYRRMMTHWDDVLPIKIHTVDYESLVTDPEPNSRALVEHCGQSWDDRCLRFHANRRAVHTPSKWQVRQPMYSSSIEKWRRFESHLAPIAASLDQSSCQ